MDLRWTIKRVMYYIKLSKYWPISPYLHLKFGPFWSSEVRPLVGIEGQKQTQFSQWQKKTAIFVPQSVL